MFVMVLEAEYSCLQACDSLAVTGDNEALHLASWSCQDPSGRGRVAVSEL